MARADEVTLLGAFGGIERGWQKVMNRLNWVSEKYSQGTRSRQEVARFVQTDFAYLVQIEVIHARVGSQETVSTEELRVTMVFHREPDGWRILHRHADVQTKTQAPQSKNAALVLTSTAAQPITPGPLSNAATYLTLRVKALTLNRDGKSLEWIAEHFMSEGHPNSSGKPWTAAMVYGLLRAQGKRSLRLEDLHRQAIAEARSRGLNYNDMAAEFNAKGIRRKDGQPWTACDIRKR